MGATNRTGFTTACQEAMTSVLYAITAADGDERRGCFTDAKLAVDRALHDAETSDEWFLAEHLARGIKDAEARAQDAA